MLFVVVLVDDNGDDVVVIIFAEAIALLAAMLESKSWFFFALVFYEKKRQSFLKKSHIFLQNRQSKKRHKTQKRPLHARFVSLRAFRVWFVPFKTRAKSWGETTLCALSLFFSSLAVRKGVNCDENTVRRAQIIIRIRLYHHITQREPLTQKRDLS